MSIHCNSDYARQFALTGRLKTPIVLPVGTIIEIVLIKTGSGERYVCNPSNGRVVINNGALGQFSIQLSAAFTNTLIPGDYVIEAHRTDNQRTRLFSGFVKVRAAL